MVRRMIASALFVFSALAATPSFASVVWKGTFEDGSISRWSKAEMVNANRLQVVNDPKGGKTKVLQVRVHQGDNPINASGNRNELVYTGDMPQNEERWYRWQTLWPDSYQSPATWQLFTQFHHVNGGGSPPLELFANGEEIMLRASGKEIWRHPLERGSWHDFVMHVNWSADGSRGYVELWYDGKQVLTRTPATTLFPGQSAYLKQGLYRNANVNFDQTLYQSGVTIGTTMDDVWPADASSGGKTLPALSQQQVNDFKQGSGCNSTSLVQWPLLLVMLGAFLMKLRQRRLALSRVRAE